MLFARRHRAKPNIHHTPLAKGPDHRQRPREMASTDTRQYWERATAGLQWRVNLTAWLEVFAPAVFALGTAAALVLFALRRTGRPEHLAAWLLVGGAIILALVAWWPARHRFFRRPDARVFLEHQLRLDSALSAALEGVAAWPVVPRETPSLLRWRATAPVGWLAGAAALWLAAQHLPVPAADPARPAEKPPALAQVEQLLGDLTAKELAAPESVAPLAEQARELAARSLEQQYTHGGLEAADALRDQAMNAVDQLARNLEAASSALAPLESSSGKLPAEQVGGASEQLGSALQGLRDGRLQPNENLLTQLNATGGGKFSGLSPEQLTSLRNALQNASGQLQQMLQQYGGVDSRIANPDGPGYEEGEGEGPGRGGIQRGRGDAPLAFTKDSSPEQQGQSQALGNEDLSRTTVGDLVGVTRDRPDVDRAKLTGPASAGTVAAPAAGGEAVWINRLTPAERAVLKDFFK